MIEWLVNALLVGFEIRGKVFFQVKRKTKNGVIEYMLRKDVIPLLFLLFLLISLSFN